MKVDSLDCSEEEASHELCSMLVYGLDMVLELLTNAMASAQTCEKEKPRIGFGRPDACSCWAAMVK
jgi:hypothetical protein